MSKQLSGVPEVSKNPLPGKQGWIAWNDLGSVSFNKNTKKKWQKEDFFAPKNFVELTIKLYYGFISQLWYDMAPSSGRFDVLCMSIVHAGGLF